MGNCCFRKMYSANQPKNITLLLVGLDDSGKTTIAKRLAGEPIDCVVPTIGFSVLNIRQRGCRVSIYDLGGGRQIRDIWPRYYADAHGIIFVVDASDEDRMEECRQVLGQLLENEQISGKPVLLLANKQDLEGAMDEIDVVDRLNLEKMVNDQKCPTLVELSSAIQFSKTIDIGLDNGYKWLIRSIMRDYPALNNRILKDFAKQEEDSKIQYFKTLTSKEKENEIIVNRGCENSFKVIRKVLEKKKYFNENRSSKEEDMNIKKMLPLVKEKSNEALRKQTHRFSNVSIFDIQNSKYNTCNKVQSEEELLKEVINQNLKNFMVRPKSSAARLNGVRTEINKKDQKRRQLKKLNKTIPSFNVPFADLSNQNRKNIQTVSSVTKSTEGNVRFLEENSDSVDIKNLENTNPFVVVHKLERAKIGEREMNLFGEKI